MNDEYALTYIEIDIDYCARSFGVAPCTASGSNKCFNTRNRSLDCGDPANFNAATKTVRFGVDTGFLPSTIECIPNLIAAEMTAPKLAPGENIGQRATLSCKFKNHRHNDVGFDKYYDTRSYDPFQTGTFWGKFVSRNPYLYRMPIRLIQGFLGQALAEMKVFNFVIEKMDGPDTDGQFSITGVDFMRFLDGDSAQVPKLSKGSLNADITDTATSATLKPSGIGAAEYPASGVLSIGEEICTFTRSSDTLTLTRGAHGSKADAHQADDTVQLCYVQTTQNEATILADIITNYTDLNSSYINTTDWQNEVTQYSNLLYTGVIPKPSPVKAVINEFIQQAGLIVYPDVEANKIRLSVLRPASDSALVFTESNTWPGVQISDTGTRYSQAWTYFYQKNKAEDLTKDTNYYTTAATIDADNPHTVESIRKVYSRWLPRSALSAAQAINNRILSRYRVAPRQFAFSVDRKNTLKLGQSIVLAHRVVENAFGQTDTVTAQIISIKPKFDRIDVIAEEMRFDERFLITDRIFIIDYSTYNLNLRALHDTIYSGISGTPVVRFVINSGVEVLGSSSVAALLTGSWPVGVNPEIINNGYIVGGGGAGGFDTSNGGDGGLAIYATHAITIKNNNVIGGGGGGGGGGNDGTHPAGGGGGAGYGRGVIAYSYAIGSGDGTLTAGGAGNGYGGAGGNLGAAGASGNRGSGGAAGVAVDGDSLVTWTTLGTVYGSRIH